MRSTKQASAGSSGTSDFLPHVSVDCVIFGFHDAALKVLLLKWRRLNLWVLPGGLVGRRESLDAAASHVLFSRAGLRKVHLRQFYAFGGLHRREAASLRKLFGRSPRFARVVSVGYYALVDYDKVKPRIDEWSDAFRWYSVDDLPKLAFDHSEIVQRARVALRESLEAPATGAHLLPAKFTMPELQRLHEAVLGRTLDRRNFQKRMLERGGILRLNERRTGGAHRSPYLYQFVAPAS